MPPPLQNTNKMSLFEVQFFLIEMTTEKLVNSIDRKCIWKKFNIFTPYKLL